jgi:transcriptional regulator with GAF, ATPase, and Fis domain
MYSLKNRIREIERDAIVKTLEGNSWIQSRAARKLGITELMIGYRNNTASERR